MKINTNQSKNEIFGTNPVNNFTLEFNPKSFQVLTDGIYSNKIRAIIRELSTNAWDSHIEANNINPFEVHLPKKDEEYFYIRDYGIGLSEDSIIKIYTSFFTSTKENTNKLQGCLGLGSKTPFCYNTRTFHIESFYNGKKYVYSFFMNDEGIPSYIKVDELDTTEPNGLKVQLAVSGSDFGLFYSEASEVYKFFENKPKFIGMQINIKEIEKRYENNNVFISDEELFVVMGNVAYPLKLDHKYLDSVKHLSESNIIIKAKIGEVDFSSSRESLSYTQKTLVFIRKKLEEYEKYLESYLNTAIDSCENSFEAALCHEKLVSEILFAINAPGMKLKKEYYKGNPLPTFIDVNCEKYTYSGNWYEKKGFNPKDKMEISNKYDYFLLQPRTRTRVKDHLSGTGRNAYILPKEDIEKLNLTKYFKDSSTLPKRVVVRRNIECWNITSNGLKESTYVDGYGIEKFNKELKINGNLYSYSFIAKLAAYYKIKIVGFSSSKFKSFEGEKFEDYYNNRADEIKKFFSDNEDSYNHYLLSKNRSYYFNGTYERIIDYYKVDCPLINFYKKNDEIASDFCKHPLHKEAVEMGYKYESKTYKKLEDEYNSVFNGFKFSTKKAIIQQLRSTNVQVQTV